MSWVAPDVTRVDESFVGDERATLEGMLDRQRLTLLWKCQGLNGEQLARQAVATSNLSLLGLVRHVADAERSWFRSRVAGEELPEVYARPDRPDAALEEAVAEDASADFDRLYEEWALCRKAAAAAAASLDAQFTHEEMGQVSLRWVYSHMIEEYARHNGHADLLREAIDGATGE